MNGSIQDIKLGLNVWIDIPDPYIDDILSIASQLNLGTDSLQWYLESSLNLSKLEIKFFENHTSTKAFALIQEGSRFCKQEIYLLSGEKWLLTLHSSKVNLMEQKDRILKNVLKTSGRISVIYYELLDQIIFSHEQSLILVEVALSKLNDRSENLLDSLNALSEDIMSVRRDVRGIQYFAKVLNQNTSDIQERGHIRNIIYKLTELSKLTDTYESEIYSLRRSFTLRNAMRIQDKIRIYFKLFFILLSVLITCLAGYFLFENKTILWGVIGGTPPFLSLFYLWGKKYYCHL